jgi:predicted PurR-regulated permease PerM
LQDEKVGLIKSDMLFNLYEFMEEQRMKKRSVIFLVIILIIGIAVIGVVSSGDFREGVKQGFEETIKELETPQKNE